MLNGDTSLIGQLINILLDNAFKYSDEGGSVTLRIGADGKCRSITVTNTSDKIDTDHLDKLFDRFYRSDKSRQFRNRRLRNRAFGGKVDRTFA